MNLHLWVCKKIITIYEEQNNLPSYVLTLYNAQSID